MTTNYNVTFKDYVAPTGWKLSRALRRLNVTREPFNHHQNPGADGYSYGRTLAIRPRPKLWTVPIIAAHELAHIVLGHTKFVVNVQELGLPVETIPFRRFELEAQVVANAVAICLSLPAKDYPADKVQRYIDGCRDEDDPITDKDEWALRLMNAVTTIVDAGEKANLA